MGIDLMPEQIALTAQWHLSGYKFEVMDAADMSEIPEVSKDIIVIFGILHHIPEWRRVIKECRRILTAGGKMFIEEPNENILRNFEKLFHWGHFDSDFSLFELEKELLNSGFKIEQKRKILGFGTYHTQKF
jgi:SAM-dependent methyltransferase